MNFYICPGKTNDLISISNHCGQFWREAISRFNSTGDYSSCMNLFYVVKLY